MHVGVEEAVAEHLGEEDLHAGARERRDVDALLPSSSAPARSACRACAPSPSLAARRSPSTPRAPAAAASPRSCAELARVRRFAHQVELVVQVPGELGHHLARLQAPALGPQRSASAAPVSSSATSRAIAASTPGRSTLTATSVPSCELRRGAPARPMRSRRASDRNPRTARPAAGQASAPPRPPPALTETAAPGPAASPARRRCRAAAGRGAWTAPGRT